jgi:hypothetical protein
MVKPAVLIASCILAFSLFANIEANNEDIVATPTASGGIEVGQVVQGYYKCPATAPQYLSHIWQQRACAAFGYDAIIKKRLEINITGGGLIAFSTPQISPDAPTLQSRPVFYINSAYAAYPFGNADAFFCKVQAGYFPYKYNPDVRNLGEYLFRTNSYPLLVYADFDNPQVNMMGVRVNVQAFGKLLSNDLLLHSELLGMPVQDWSIADIVSLNLFDVFTIGGGLDFTHLLNVYQGTGYLHQWMEYYYYPQRVDPGDIAPFIVRDTVVNGPDTVINSDTLDWKATKLMMRFAFDPKRFLPPGIFGENDLKLYGEADIIGLKNYFQYDEFKNRNMRTLWTFGFNFPEIKCIKHLPGISSLSGSRVFNFLIDLINIDLVNLEMEYCADTASAFSDEGLYPNGVGIAPNLRPPLLSVINGNYGMNIKRNPWRWSLYLKKTVLDGHVNFIAQFARDHRKINFNYWDIKYMSFMETLPSNRDWWWTFKTEFKF